MSSREHLDPPDATSDAELLEAEISRGRRLDHQLADDLGRPEPRRSAVDDGLYAALDAGGGPESGAELRLVAAAQAGDAQARAALIEACLPRISAMARTYRSGQVQRQELLQEGVVGVLRALERFDPARGVPFWGYAGWWVRHAMQQLVSELTRPVVLSDRALRNLAHLKQAQHDALQQDARNPTPDELARRSGLEPDQVRDLLASERSPRAMEEPAGDHDVGTFGDLLEDPMAQDAYERVLAEIESATLHGLLAGLSDRERRVLRAHYGLDGAELSLREIGEQLGLSAERVRQIEAVALGKLAARLSAGPHH